jgi:uncharacterized protein (TIGR02118 family)
MYRVTIVYNHPTDPAAFDEHYRTRHLPLVREVPDVVHFAGGHCDGMGGQPAQAYFLAQLYFSSAETAGAALSSNEGQAAAADLENFADGGVSMLFSDESIVLP